MITKNFLILTCTKFEELMLDTSQRSGKNMHLPFQRLLSILGLAKENCSRLQMIIVIPVL